MFGAMSVVGSDVDARGGIRRGSLPWERMTVAES